MHFPTITTLLTSVLVFVPVISAWDLYINYADGVVTPINGHTNSHCQRFKKTDSDIESVTFKSGVFADTFVLYRDSRCRSEGYRGRKGNNNVPDEIYLSYKVY